MNTTKEDLTAKKRAVKRQVKDAYRGVISAISRVETLKAAVISATSVLEATEADFGARTRNMVDVLIKQRNLYRAKRDFLRTRYDYLINSIKLKQDPMLSLLGPRHASLIIIDQSNCVLFVNNYPLSK